MNAGDIVIGLDADTSGFTQQMAAAQQQTAKTTDAISASLEKLAGASNGLDQTSQKTTQLSDNLQKLKQDLNQETAARETAYRASIVGSAASIYALKKQSDSLARLRELQGDANQAIEDCAKDQKTAATAADGNTAAVNRLNEAAKKTANETGAALRRLGHDIADIAVGFGVLAVGAKVWESAGPNIAQRLGSVYRVGRFAMSPTPLTAATLLAGIAVEKTAETAYSEAGIVRSQGTAAGLNKVQITPEDLSAQALAGKERTGYLELYNNQTGQNAGDKQGKDLRNLAEQLAAIKDPTDKARAAVKLFGDDAAKALGLLDQRFVENADRVKDWGLVYDEETRQRLMQFREDIDSLKTPFEGFGDTLHDTLQQAKTELITFFAFTYSKIRETDSGQALKDAFAPFNLDETLKPLEGLFQNAERGGPLAPFNLDKTFDGLSKGLEDLPSGIRGFGSVVAAGFRGSKPIGGGPGAGTMFGPADAQYRAEQMRLLGQDPTLKGVLDTANNQASEKFLGSALSSYGDLNKAAPDLQGLRDKLAGQEESRNKILKEFFVIGPDGTPQAKDRSGNSDKVSGVTELTDINAHIRDTRGLIDKAEKAKQETERAGTKLKESAQVRASMMQQLAAEVQVSRLNVPGFAERAFPAEMGLAQPPASEPSLQFARKSPQAQGEGATVRVIAERNRELARLGSGLSQAEKQTVALAEAQTAQNQAETEWRNKLSESETGIVAHTTSQNLLTDAIGKGGEAARKTAIEGQMMSILGAQYADKEWLDQKNVTEGIDHRRDAEALRGGLAAELAAEAILQSSQATDGLTDQIEQTKNLTAAELLGRDAVERVTLAYKLRAIWASAATAEEKTAAAARIQAEIGLFDQQKDRQTVVDLKPINQQISDIQRVAAAQMDGAEAVRRAQLAAKYAEMDIQGKAPEVIAAEGEKDRLQHLQDIQGQALGIGNAYRDQLQSIGDQIGALEQLKQKGQDSLGIEISLHQLEIDRNRVLSDQVMIMGSATDGLKAYFREMASGSESAAKQMHDVLTSAFGGLNDELSHLLTGQKTNWAGFFHGLGESLVKTSLQNLEHDIAAKVAGNKPGGDGKPGQKTGIGGALGKLGGILGLPPSGNGSSLLYDGQSISTAFFVQLAGQPGGSGNGSSLPVISASGKGNRTSQDDSLNVDYGGGISGVSLGGTAGITTEDQANLGGFDNSELGQLENGGNAAGGIGGSLGGGTLTAEDQANLGDFSNSELGQLENGASGGGALAAIGSTLKLPGVAGLAGLGIGLLGMLFKHQPVNRHFAIGNPYVLPSYGGGRALGGDVDPSQSYMVGEQGPEPFVPKSAGTILPHGTLGGGNTYYIDARGTDPAATEQRVRQAMAVTHNASVRSSFRATQEFAKRTPQK